MKPKMPTSTQCSRLLYLLNNGETMNPVKALNSGVGFRCSERVRELEALGWQIERGWFKTAGGARVRSYRLK